MSYFWLIVPYLLGSVSFSYIAGRIFGGIDIRTVGSGNAGATNVYRNLGLKPFLFASFFDILKGLVAVILTKSLFPENEILIILSAVAVIIGHNWPIFFGFKGGKGIASTIGVVIGLHPLSALIVIVTMALIVYITRYVSLGSLISTLLLPILFYLFMGDKVYYIIFALVLTVMAWYRHRSNIKRLLNGTESKLGQKR
ncbi:glycerol-3-phosphate acyltransferase PlsY [Anaerobranca californiensis DSM 14826]|uniref:Glycerol-3-phosphate acyltransferase n=1 Tax=Anaerobranca californiensis DSM 14826 TaxID=1120989 RepID=A0A1M6N786_9FIRM|nr:glycerol-3-phosphate 1-O-acyltransferase PlsY [Anaerobranca californiensis]SHJ91600.1 glycerol-3-phosphate acyltransferase PlsY [Anaerobranca californiensis DSM 14826]